MKKKEINDFYQERSKTAGERASELAWAMIAILCCALIGNKLITSFVVSGTLSLVYFLLSALQAVWQAVTAWIFKNHIDDSEEVLDYPNWVGGGAWVFYYLKMIAITVAVIYFVKDMVSLF